MFLYYENINRSGTAIVVFQNIFFQTKKKLITIKKRLVLGILFEV